MTKLTTACLVLGLVAAGFAQDHPPARGSGVLHTDPLNGYSLRLPPGAERFQSENASPLGHWIERDSKTGETLWTLRVYRTAVERKADIQATAKALALRIEQGIGGKLEPEKISKISGRPAILLAGLIDTPSKADATGIQAKPQAMRFRQAWVETEPGMFFVMEYVTTDKDDAGIEATWFRLLSSLRLFDPEGFLLRQKNNSRRAEELLRKASAEGALAAVLPEGTQWFLVSQKGKPVGWVCLAGLATRRNNSPGYEVQVASMVQLPDQPVRLVRQRMFLSTNGEVEAWHAVVQIGTGETSKLLVEDGLRQGTLIFATFGDGDRLDKAQKNLPKAVAGMYLPKTIGILLPGLIDRTPGVEYTFAEYDRGENDFQMRTVAVVGPEEIEYAGRRVRAVKITDQVGPDSDPLTLWLDKHGAVLRSRTPEGLVNEAAAEAEVRLAFPTVKAVLAEMAKAERAPSKPAGARQNRK